MQYLVEFVQHHPETAAPVNSEHRPQRTPISAARALQPSPKPPKPRHLLQQFFAPSIHEAERDFAKLNPTLTVLQVSRITAGKGKILDDPYVDTGTDEPTDRIVS